MKGTNLSHYDGQRYDLSASSEVDRKFRHKAEMKLVADNWLKSNSRGQSFTINQYNKKQVFFVMFAFVCSGSVDLLFHSKIIYERKRKKL